ncbi:MAG: adenosylcobalamin-dependent ribonucleoside-diphosphate reductase [Candidatus Tectomicrobia bacterium]|uniref:Vitamin B12-dependent ribonucleotide reductase n=1 Tax=Tectimicrobiota bacterium TaxID=2528274 RepID=A0A932M0Q9_UNCTE|nr:adenosylcobalamin-dependent ribonucleoside-diphosphate reductase [Candidatus Tectomicrobia bacterium]
MTQELVQRGEWGATTVPAIPESPAPVEEGQLERPAADSRPSQELLRDLERKCLRSDHGGMLLVKALDASEYYGDDDLAVNVLNSKYLAPGETGPFHLWDRTARAVASVESNRDYWYYQFMSILIDFKFVPGGRVMHAAGREDARRRPTLSNCYVIPIVEDSLEGIYTCLMESALVYRTGGGVGTDLSILRPEGAPVNATVDKSPGATAFMNLLSESTNTVSQAGRRGALMLTLRVDHPDIERFITIKNDPERRKVQYANISVLVTHEFMQAVLNDEDFSLRWGEKVFRTVRARDLWKKIIENAHASAEPGVIFWDTMREYHNLEYMNPLSSTNPCGEQPLAAYTACNLGSLNLTAFVREDGSFDYVDLAETTRVATRFLDDVIDYNMDNHALDKIKEAVASDRRVGLGITGLADALVCMKIRYDSEEALQTVDRMMRTIRDSAYRTSVDLAREKGPFPVFNWEGYSQSRFVQALPEEIREEIRRSGIRNGTVITVPPVGTGSIVARSSSGVEPIFCTSYRRRVKNADGESFQEYKVYHHLIQKLFGGDENLPPHVVTAHEIDPYFRVKMQGVIQNYVDSAISSTVNLPEDVSVETVADIYLTAYKRKRQKRKRSSSHRRRNPRLLRP